MFIFKFAANASLDKSVREASTKAEKQINDLTIDLSLRKDINQNVKVFSQSVEAMNMNYEQKRFVQKVLKDGKRNGLLLSGNKLKEFKKIKKSISTLGVDFGKCLADDTSHFYAEEKDLAAGVFKKTLRGLKS